MKPTKLYFFSIALLLACTCTTNLNAQCCKLPDSLKVISVTDTSFCVKWNRNDTSRCDTAKAWQLRYKKATSTAWKYFKDNYYGANTHTFCDTVKPCTDWKWQVRNICIKNGDSTFTDWVTGPDFSTKCDTAHKSFNPTPAAQHQLKITPNPAKDRIVISGVFAGKVSISISNMIGRKVYETTVIVQGNFNLAVDVSAYESGLHFITITNGKDIIKTSFIKE